MYYHHSCTTFNETVEKYFKNISISNASNDTYDHVFADWIKYTESNVFEITKQIDDLSSDFVRCFFNVQSFIALDWLQYKFKERLRPYLELGFFIPFSIVEHKNGTKFAKNIVEMGYDTVCKQCAKYVGMKVDSFLTELQKLKDNGYS